MCAGAELVIMSTPPIESELIMVGEGRSRHPYVSTLYVGNSEGGLVNNAEEGVLLQHPCAPRLDSGGVAQQLVIAALRFAATSTDRLSFFCVRKASANSALSTSSGDSTFVLSMSKKTRSSASVRRRASASSAVTAGRACAVEC